MLTPGRMLSVLQQKQCSLSLKFREKMSLGLKQEGNLAERSAEGSGCAATDAACCSAFLFGCPVVFIQCDNFCRSALCVTGGTPLCPHS